MIKIRLTSVFNRLVIPLLVIILVIIVIELWWVSDLKRLDYLSAMDCQTYDWVVRDKTATEPLTYSNILSEAFVAEVPSGRVNKYGKNQSLAKKGCYGINVYDADTEKKINRNIRWLVYYDNKGNVKMRTTGFLFFPSSKILMTTPF